MRVRVASAMTLVVIVAVMLAVLASLGPASSSVALSSAPSVSQATSRIEQRTFWSTALGRQMAYRVYVPAGYGLDSYSRYPVLYMLHSLGGDQQDWERAGMVRAADELTSQGEIPPMIIVEPEGERGYWLDHANNGPKYGTYISRDLVAEVDRQFRTITEGNFRAIGGMSMGSHGALQIALNNPGKFAIVGAHSLVLRNKDQAFEFFGDRQYFEAHDPVSLSTRNASQLRALTLWIDIGASDNWIGAARGYHQLLQTLNVKHVFSVKEGGHDASYWRSRVGEYLRYYGDAFESAWQRALAQGY